ncbi:peptide-methionine (S)-S-oxide reductase MsrA [Opitutales bacterium]|nr:peptide-methionine (S)-S-oxide reductase MsrA [Opitutales bacterium]
MIKMKYYSYFCMITLLINAGCLRQEEASIKTDLEEVELDIIKKVNMETIVLGGGCFWCTEAVFEKLDGIKDVISGYAGGEILNPTYKQICTGNTGHAEVIKITFDPAVISFTAVLDIFGDCHDPTTLNRQGADVGTQYRSTIMYLSEKQKELAIQWKEKLSKKLEDPVVTEIVAVPVFYSAEEYHQDYYRKNPNEGYCNFVIRPKLKKLNLE